MDQKAARSTYAASEDSPDNIDSLYDELEEPEDAGQVISRTRGSDAVWLARYIRQRLEKDQDSVREEMEKELDVGLRYFLGGPVLRHLHIRISARRETYALSESSLFRTPGQASTLPTGLRN